jgi:hypothetical protein
MGTKGRYDTPEKKRYHSRTGEARLWATGSEVESVIQLREESEMRPFKPKKNIKCLACDRLF